MNFSIIIPSLGEKTSSLIRLLKSIDGIVYEHDFEVILVLNSFSKFTEGALNKHVFDKITPRIVYEQRRGPSFCRNVGAQISRYPHLIFWDDDCQVSSNILTLYKDAWTKYKGAKIIGGPVVSYNNKLESLHTNSLFVKHQWCFTNLSYGTSDRRITTGELLFSANISYLKSTQLEEPFNTNFGVSMFDDKILFGAEDYYLCNRVNLQKKIIYYVSNLAISHKFDNSRLSFAYVFKRHILAAIELSFMESLLEKQFPKQYEKFSYACKVKKAFIKILFLDFSYANYFNSAHKLILILSYFLHKRLFNGTSRK